MIPYKIVYVDKIGDGSYGGLHYRAAKELGIDFPYSEETILILRDRDGPTIFHETIEAELIFHLKMHYKEAHQRTQEIEKRRQRKACDCGSTRFFLLNYWKAKSGRSRTELESYIFQCYDCHKNFRINLKVIP